jgi:hypothetical protein
MIGAEHLVKEADLTDVFHHLPSFPIGLDA